MARPGDGLVECRESRQIAGVTVAECLDTPARHLCRWKNRRAAGQLFRGGFPPATGDAVYCNWIATIPRLVYSGRILRAHIPMIKTSLRVIVTTFATLLFAATGGAAVVEPLPSEKKAVREAEVVLHTVGGIMTRDFKSNRITVLFRNPSLTDDDLLRVSDALVTINPHVLDLKTTKVTGVGLWTRFRLTHLDTLDLSSTLVSDAGLRELKYLEYLRYLRNRPSTISLSFDYLTLSALDGFVDDFACFPLTLLLQSITVTDDAGDKVKTNRVLTTLKGLHQLQGLSLSGNPITDEDLNCLKDFSKLSDLRLSDCKLTDDSMQILGIVLKSFKLQRLYLSDNKEVTDIGLACLNNAGQLNQLKELGLAGTGHPELQNGFKAGVTNDGLIQVVTGRPKGSPPPGRSGPCLDVLDVSNTLVLFNASLFCKLRSNLKQLKSLNVSGTGINDGDMGAIANAKQLRFLAISDTLVKNKGLERLAKLYALEFIYTENSKVTPAGVVRLAALQQSGRAANVADDTSPRSARPSQTRPLQNKARLPVN
jgi:internalin A